MPLLRSSQGTLRTARHALGSSIARPAAGSVRHKTTTTAANLNAPSNRIRNAIYGSLLVGAVGYTYLELTDTRSAFHRYTLPSLLRYIYSGDDIESPGPEGAHELGIRALRSLHYLGLPLHERGSHDYLAAPHISPVIFGRRLNTPLAISAGLDKHAEAIDALYDLSPAISLLEVGCITPLPQPGNEKPRMFRLPTSESLINRYGFNSQGADAAARRLRERIRRYGIANDMTEEEVLASDIPASLREGRLLAVQIGKNKTTSETDIEGVKRDYVTCVDKLGRYADILVVNVSSPNTPGLRDLQKGNVLAELLSAVTEAAKEAPRKWKPQVVVKVSPDLSSYDEVQEIAGAVSASGVAGVIVSNTTTVRPPAVLDSPQTSPEERRIFWQEKGGLSGPALFPRTMQLVRAFRRELGPNKVVFANGGIRTGEEAVQVRNEGADMVMAYTGMVYGGVGFFGKVANEMARIYGGKR